MREVELPRRWGWCGTGGFRLLSTAVRFPRVLSTDSVSPAPRVRPFLLRFELSSVDERRAVVVGVGHGAGRAVAVGVAARRVPTGCSMRCRCGSRDLPPVPLLLPFMTCATKRSSYGTGEPFRVLRSPVTPTAAPRPTTARGAATHSATSPALHQPAAPAAGPLRYSARSSIFGAPIGAASPRVTAASWLSRARWRSAMRAGSSRTFCRYFGPRATIWSRSVSSIRKMRSRSAGSAVYSESRYDAA